MTGALIGAVMVGQAWASETPEPVHDAAPELEFTDSPAPWEAGPELFAPPYTLRGVAAYNRYQRMAANVGGPLFLGGAAAIGYGAYNVWWLNRPGDGSLAILAGGAVAWAGAGMMTYGSVSALQELYGDAPTGGRLLPGHLAYGLLGISGLGYMGAVYSALLVPAISLPLLAVAAPFGVAAGIPALLQVVTNPGHRRAWERRQVSVVPMVRQQGTGVAVGLRF